MMTLALDTNIVSYILKGDETVIDHYRQEARKDNLFILPPIVYYELKRWLIEKGAVKKSKEFDELCQTIPLGELDQQTWDIAANLYVQARKKGRPADDADLIIAAFCLANDCSLVTNNIRHFENIEGLRIINWKE